MSTKTIFKRIALVAVAALGLGVLSVAPSQAGVTVGSDHSLTLSSATASVQTGETASTTITISFTTLVATESVGVVVLGSGATAGVNSNVASGGKGAMLSALLADSANATFSVPAESAVVQAGVVNQAQMYVTQSTAGNIVTAKFRLDIRSVDTVGSYVYSISTRAKDGTVMTAKSFTVTVTAPVLDTTAVAAKSLMYINKVTCPASNSWCTGSTAGMSINGVEADSSLVVSAGTPAPGSVVTPVAVGYVHGIFMNASDTKTVYYQGSPSTVTASLIVAISGPGFLSSVNAATKSKSVTITSSADTITVWSDGTSGTGTITGYIGTTALTQSSKSVVFNGKATTFTATANAVTTEGSNLNANDSTTTGTAIVTFVAKDSAGNVVSDAALNTNSNFYVISSDSYVVRATSSATLAYKACTLKTASTGTWTCSMDVVDSGTVTLTIADSFTVASSAYTSSAITIVAAGTAYTGTISFDKASYSPGEAAIITVTAKDRAGRLVGQSTVAGAAHNPFSDVVQNKAFSSVKSGYGFGGGTGTSFDVSSSTFDQGVETYVVYMPTTAGDVTITANTSMNGSVGTAITAKVAVVDANAASIAAAKDAADAATDAALEATDAAYAATDAANIAAEAADAATAAAEAATDAANAAKESADAATAAVEELATSVAKLMAALQAQITTLAKVVAKIAVKVKA